jgi:hypothetical protein
MKKWRQLAIWADNGKESAQRQLMDQAKMLGISRDEVDCCADWREVADLLRLVKRRQMREQRRQTRQPRQERITHGHERAVLALVEEARNAWTALEGLTEDEEGEFHYLCNRMREMVAARIGTVVLEEG